MLLQFLIFSILFVVLTDAKNDTALVKYHPKENGAPVCQDNEFECYLFTGACKAVATKKFMHEACQYTCAVCHDPKTKFAFPKKYAAFFGSTQFKYYSNNYYSGYNGYCCGCYGGGFVGFAGFLLGLGLSIGNGLANLGALLAHGGLGSYGYGFGGSYYCIDYLPGCYLYVPYCYSPLSYYYSCMARYCAVTCGFCIPGSVGGPGLIAGYNPAQYPGVTQTGVGYYPQTGGGYYYPQQQPYQYGNQNGGGYYYPQQQPYQYGNQYGNQYGYQYGK